jgi:ABC-type bacteriocin/lantibiotic exporter with double-glycine peptidase domain
VQNLPQVGLALVLIFGGWLVIHSHLGVGAILAFSACIVMLQAPYFDLHLRPGETVAMVGRTATGKTTVSRLLPRFHDVQQGSVEIDGHDVRALTLAGQRQRLAIARTLLVNPPILVLDDATSAIDVQVELQIHAGLRELMRGRTTLIVAHRHSSRSTLNRPAPIQLRQPTSCPRPKERRDELRRRRPDVRSRRRVPQCRGAGRRAAVRRNPLRAAEGRRQAAGRGARPRRTERRVPADRRHRGRQPSQPARAVTAHNRQRRNVVQHRNVVGEYRAANNFTAQINAIYGPGTQLLGYLGQAALLAIGGHMVIRHQLSIGAVVAFFLYLNRFFAPIQLIALARAFLAHPRVLVLDEATSNLDLLSETRIEAALDVLLEARTAVLIAHRLTTAMKADRIVVVDGGRIAELGSHDELVAQGGRYAEMYATWISHDEKQAA